MNNCPVASLITINYNGVDLLSDCIESVLSMLRARDELLVVDNASIDTSLAVLARYINIVKMTPFSKNLGFGRACYLVTVRVSSAVLSASMTPAHLPLLFLFDGLIDAGLNPVQRKDPQ